MFSIKDSFAPLLINRNKVLVLIYKIRYSRLFGNCWVNRAFHCSIIGEVSNEAAWPNTTVTQVTLETANASFGVLFALACACRVSAFLTIVGAFRALWLVTIATLPRSIGPAACPRRARDAAI